jgi:hypothetical protein
MTLENKISQLFQMDEATWTRHSNPWSVWTRNTVLPLLILGIWSRIWLGWWSLLLVAVALLWNWVNPRLFAQPETTDNWASKAVFGERVWMNRDTIPVPTQHQSMPNILTTVAAIGTGFVAWGVIELDIWITLFGVALIYAGKLWFLDRMVWLYEDMKDTNPEYQSWLYSPK